MCSPNSIQIDIIMCQHLLGRPTQSLTSLLSDWCARLVAFGIWCWQVLVLFPSFRAAAACPGKNPSLASRCLAKTYLSWLQSGSSCIVAHLDRPSVSEIKTSPSWSRLRRAKDSLLLSGIPSSQICSTRCLWKACTGKQSCSMIDRVEQFQRF